MSKEISSVHGLVDVRHCLRPELTALMIRMATEKHQSINVIGARGSGKLRLLIDIQNCVIPGVKTVAVNLKSFTADYDGLLLDLQGQLQLAGEAPARLQQLFNRVENQRLHYLILLGNYDALLGNPALDPKYDKHFFDDLNHIKDVANFSLICSTVHHHHTMPVLLHGKSLGHSWLNVETVAIPPLTRHQIIDELERRFDEYDRLWLKSNYDEKELLVNKILNLTLPYSLLVFIAGRFSNQTPDERGMTFKKKLKQWITIFAAQNRGGFHKQSPFKNFSPAGIWNAIQTYLKSR